MNLIKLIKCLISNTFLYNSRCVEKKHIYHLVSNWNDCIIKCSLLEYSCLTILMAVYGGNRILEKKKHTRNFNMSSQFGTISRSVRVSVCAYLSKWIDFDRVSENIKRKRVKFTISAAFVFACHSVLIWLRSHKFIHHLRVY